MIMMQLYHKILFLITHRALNRDIKGMKIGVPKEYFVEGIAEGVRKVLNEALEKLRELGAVDCRYLSSSHKVSLYLYLLCPCSC